MSSFIDGANLEDEFDGRIMISDVRWIQEKKGKKEKEGEKIARSS